MPSSSTRCYVGNRLFAIENSAFFGTEFDSNFVDKSGLVRLGDSFENAFVIFVERNAVPKAWIKAFIQQDAANLKKK
jgi:hypothetical protein